MPKEEDPITMSLKDQATAIDLERLTDFVEGDEEDDSSKPINLHGFDQKKGIKYIPDGTVIVVDDYKDDIFSTVTKLKIARIPFVSITGRQASVLACSFLNQIPEDERPHIRTILLDKMMPDFDGVEVLRHVRSLPGYKTTPMAIITASDAGEMKAQDQDAAEFARAIAENGVTAMIKDKFNSYSINDALGIIQNLTSALFATGTPV